MIFVGQLYYNSINTDDLISGKAGTYMENIFLQYSLIFLVSMVPFIEAFLVIPTAIIGFKLPPFIVLIVAFLGNAMSIFLFMYFGAEIKKQLGSLYHTFKKKQKTSKEMNPRIKQSFDRFGATGVCLLSPFLFSSQIGAGAMTTLGVSRKQVFIWTNIGVSTLALVMVTLSIVAEELVASLLNI